MIKKQEAKPIDIKNVTSVYSGKINACCCGCSGKYYYSSTHREFSSKERGYEVTDDEVNDKMVAKIVRFYNENMDKVMVYDDEGSSEIIASVKFSETRVYNIYAMKEVK